MSPEISAAFEGFRPENRIILRKVRRLILDLAEVNPRIGPLTETLKWSEPAYLTERTKAGSTLRLGETKRDSQPALFVNCKTTLISQFQRSYPQTFEYRDNRTLILKDDLDETVEPLRDCVELTLTYHLRK